MYKHKADYTRNYKKIMVQLLLSIFIFLFENCNKLNLTPVYYVSPQPTQEVDQRKTIVNDEQEYKGLIQQVHTGFSRLCP